MALNSILAIGRSIKEARASEMGPRRFGFCTVANTGTSKIRAACARKTAPEITLGASQMVAIIVG